MSKPYEKKFEEDIELSLIRNNKYIKRTSSNYDPELCLDPDMLFDFIRTTQPEEWKRLKSRHGEDVKEKFLERLTKDIKKRGTLKVLRTGVKDVGCHFDLIYFKPENGLNVEHQDKYRANIFSAIRQLHYSTKTPEKSIDMVLFINGIPIITAELKSPLNGQSVEHAIDQYKERDSIEPLLSFGRCFAHFAVDPRLVFMTTKLMGESTEFLPFNKGYQYGAGNPPAYGEDNYDTAYLWEEIWKKDMLLDIMQNFLQIVSKKGKNGAISTQLIFPRYHQLDALNLLVENTRINGAGRKYLIEHSAGSGKSYTISRLCDKLSGLHDESNKNIFDSIIVITDRRVLDDQLSRTILGHEHIEGTIVSIEKDKAKNLAKAIESNVKIIIVTLQTFPFAIDFFHKTPGKRFAVVIDEAHSSQTGDAARDLRRVLVTEDSIEYEDEQEKDVEDIINEKMEEITTDLKLQPKNISFYAFTATPKNKTLEVFGERQQDGTFEPFHLYSMKQAIEEGFILDVLQNYTTYTTYFELIKKIEDDPKYKKTIASSLLKSYVGSSEYAIKKKTELMLDHFWTGTKDRIGGRAKAMVVTSSRANAIRYELEFKKQIKEREYPFEVLVAFSGTVKGEDVRKVYTGKDFTESGENGFPEKNTAEKFKEDKYRILIVASKFQTGFDQPLLHTMYVDKKLGGVEAVQTLSRLNRRHPEKSDTMVLDFVNDAEKIREPFQRYHVKTILTEPTDPNKLYDYENQLIDFAVFDNSDIDKFAAEYFSKRGNQAVLYTSLRPAIERWSRLEDDEKRDFKKRMATFVRQYAFLSQIIPFFDEKLEKFYQYSKYLVKELHVDLDRLPTEITEKVNMSSFRIQETSKGSILLSDDDGRLRPVPEPGVTHSIEDELTPLSEIIKDINEHFGTDFTEEDKVGQALGYLEKNLIENPRLVAAANPAVNKKEDFDLVFKEIVLDEFDELIDVNIDLYSKIKDDANFGSMIKELLLNNVYKSLVQKE